jgi:hypothetical protein
MSSYFAEAEDSLLRAQPLEILRTTATLAAPANRLSQVETPLFSRQLVAMCIDGFVERR